MARQDPLELLDQAADEYDLRATEFDSIGEPELIPSVKLNEERAKELRLLINKWRKKETHDHADDERRDQQGR